MIEWRVIFVFHDDWSIHIKGEGCWLQLRRESCYAENI